MATADSVQKSAPSDANDSSVNSDHVTFSIPVSTDHVEVPGQIRINTSVEQTGSNGSSRRRFLTGSFHPQLDEDEENEIVSQAGDSGDRALSRRGSKRGSGRVYANEEVVFPITVSQVTPFSSDVVNTISKDADPLMELEEKEKEKKELPPSFEYISYLIHLAVFGILGVLTRYLLQKLFGPSVAGVTSDSSILYLDLPSNMVGSFLMGWLGVVFKSNIARFSDQLAIGLSTGYLGSLTTFSGWNQKMLDLSVHGHWVSAVLGFFLGLILAAGSISLGIETAEGFRWLLRRIGKRWGFKKWRVNRFKCNLVVLLVLVLMWAGLWTTSGILEKEKFRDGGSGAQLWLACFVGPLGVWMRWWLARLNGRGVGTSGLWKWVPFGTLIANVSAACVMAALATLKKAVNTKDCETVATGIQFGLMGCLSTVSTLMAEFNALRKSSHPWRAYAYASMTIGISFGLGTLIYSVPVWTKGYN
ncbi:fluoride export protein 1-like [Silene latifolia]|uniref:fluoride export protein 1-like n=1 Tax=Silene latifolia TaxID=37657 RepID=UPI003D76B84F